MLEDRAGGGVDLVAVLHAAGFELDLIDERAVLVVQFDLHVIRLVLAHARVVQGDGLRLGMADVAGGRNRLCRLIPYRGRGRQVLLPAEHLPRVGVHQILKLTPCCVQLHLVVRGEFVQLGIDLRRDGVQRRCPGILLRGVSGGILTDGHGGRACFRKVLQLLHRELRQRVKLERRVDGEDTVHQRRLTGGNAVFPGLLLPRRILRQRLRQDGGLRFAGLQHTVHGAGQLTLELFRADGILILHRDHDGGGNAVQIAVPHQAAHNGVYRHIQLRTLQVCTAAHIRKDGLRILVERCADQHLFAFADLQLDAGVYVQRHHGRHRVCLLIEHASAAQQHHREAGSHKRCPFSIYRFLCCHGNYRSFPLITAGENAVHVVWRGLFHRRSQTLLHFFIGHRASSPSRQLRIFFNAL